MKVQEVILESFLEKESITGIVCFHTQMRDYLNKQVKVNFIIFMPETKCLRHKLGLLYLFS